MAERTLPPLARRLKHLRGAAGLTQQELATRARLSISLVTQLEQGLKTDPKLSTLTALADALGVAVTRLLASEGPDAKQQSTPVDPQLVALIEELEEWDHMHEFQRSPSALRVIAFKFRGLLGLPKRRRTRKEKGKEK